MQPSRKPNLDLSAKKRALLDALLRKDGVATADGRIPVREDRGPAPLSFAQERVWFLEQFADGAPLFNIPGAVPLRGMLDLAALQASLDQIAARHDVLRTTLDVVDGQPRQVVLDPTPVPLPLVDLSDRPAGQRWSQAVALLAADARLAFDVRRGPLWRCQLVRLAPDQHLFYVCMHHSISEAAALGVLFHELAQLYGAYGGGDAAPLAPLPVQYADYAEWQRRAVAAGSAAAQIEYWKQQLAGSLPLVQLPTDRPRPAQQSFRGAFAVRPLPVELTDRLKALAREEGATPFMLFLAAFNVLLARYGGLDDVVVGAPIARRDRAELAGLIGFFVNTIVLRSDLSGAPSFREVLRRVRATALQAYSHSDVPFELVVEAVQPERDQSRNPLFQVMFDLPAEARPRLELPGLEPARVLAPIDLHSGTTKVDLALFLWEGESGMQSAVEYATDLFDAATIDRLLGHYEQLLRGIAADPDAEIARLPLLTAAERRQVLEEWNATRVELPPATTSVVLVERQAAQTPQALAISGAGTALSYAEWNAEANRLAHALRRLGVGPDVLVAVCMERTPAMVTALLAVWKAGGAYVPLDPGNPADRQAMMLEDARVPVLLTQESVLPRLPTTAARVVALDRDRALFAGESDANPPRQDNADRLAYVIFTSGSTGRPKGVEIPHRGLLNLVRWHQRRYAVAPSDRATQLAGLAFDASVWELWPYLTAGASIHLPSEETRAAPAELLAWLAAERITLSFLPTPLAELVLREPVPKGLALRAVLTGGDKLHQPPPPQTPYRLVNHYGPSESSVVTTCTDVPPGDASVAPPIGRPIDNTTAYLVDACGQPVPIGIPGELWVGGEGLARGYHGRPDLTAERFVANPFVATPGARVYRTGDLARWRADGQIEFLGRIDHQVKVRGFRIELGEIEATLRRHPAVAEALVLLREDRPGEKRLAAYVVGPSPAPSGAELRAFLSDKLPDYMVPSAYQHLLAFPLTRNGKVDRAALPVPQESGAATGAGEAALPRTELERRIAALWAELLSTAKVGLDDNFFELGGHSLLMVQVRNRLEAELGVSVTMVQLFRHPTVRALAVALGPPGAASDDSGQHREGMIGGREALRRRRQRRGGDGAPTA